MLARKQEMNKSEVKVNQTRHISSVIGNQAMYQNTKSDIQSPIQRILFTDVDVNKVRETDNMSIWWKMACERNFQKAKGNDTAPLTYIFSLRDIVLGEKPSNLAPETKIRLENGDRVRFASHGYPDGQMVTTLSTTTHHPLEPAHALDRVSELVETTGGSPLPHDKEHVGFEFCHMLANPKVNSILSQDPTKPLSSQLGTGPVLNPPGRILFVKPRDCIEYIKSYSEGDHDWTWVITDDLSWKSVSEVVKSNRVPIFSDYKENKRNDINLTDVLDTLYVEIGNSFDQIGRILETANARAISTGAPSLLNGSLPDPWT